MRVASSVSIGLGLAACAALAAEPPAWKAVVAPSGAVSLARGQEAIADIEPGLFAAGWRGAGVQAVTQVGAVGREQRLGRITAPDGQVVECEVRPRQEAGALVLAYRLTPQAEVALNSLHVTVEFPAGVLAGGSYTADGETGEFPAQFAEGRVHLRSKPTQALQVRLPGGDSLDLQLTAPVPVLLQDNRQWGPSFSVRIGPQLDAAQPWPAGKPLEIEFRLAVSGALRVDYDDPVTLAADADWLPLNTELDIEPGSALDFSGFGQLDAPAGKHGWVIATPDGHFAFDQDPARPRRFYGVNFCFSANYIGHEQADLLAERLARLGYNAVRIHHYEGMLVDRSQGTSTTFKAVELDQLDYLLAAFSKRGLYITTDLYVSRPVLNAEIWPGEAGDVAMDDFKMLVPVNARAMENWKAFARNLLTHVNPYTGRRYAADPALAWLSMINEGNVGNHVGSLKGRVLEDWQREWNAWLKAKYADAAAVQQAWGRDPGGDPAAGTVPLVRDPRAGAAGTDLAVFLTHVEQRMFRDMKRFLREEIGTKALLTDMNAWTNPVQTQVVRRDYDYVDDHFYVDHPQFIDKPWRLPSRCANTSPVAEGAPGGRACAFTRLLDKPFTITEYNYSGPGRFRGVGGILTGCMGALQDWSGIWRFAYSHSRDNLFKPGTAGYFDVVSDPLNQAAERATLCLFLRGDMKPAPHAVGITMTEPDLLQTALRKDGLAPGWHALALVTRVGTSLVAADGKGAAALDLALPLAVADAALPAPYSAEAGARILAEARTRGWLAAGNITDLGRRRLQSETGELTVDGPADTLVLNTPCTAGAYTPAGRTVTAGAVTVAVQQTDATVWVSSLDGQPIAASSRLLITHLTDLQNTGASFAEGSRKTLLAWGKLPHLVRSGQAAVTIRSGAVASAEVWALSTGGRRLAKVEATVGPQGVVVPLDVRGAEGARLLYEVVIKR